VSTYRIPFNRPTSSPNAAACIGEALANGRLSGNGPFTHNCEAALEAITGARKALLTNSCTGALEIAALLLDDAAEGTSLRRSGRQRDEVIVPSFTFVSTANAFAMRGLRPVFADCRADTLNVDERSVERLIGPRTRAIVVMHYGGVGCDMEAILEIARRRGVVVIEDNAHGLFGRYRGRALGTFGAVATQSFHETKNVTCGEGGALLVNDEALVERAEVIREKGTNRSRFFRGQVDKYTWVDFGSNYLMSELQAASLFAQLESRESIQRARHAVWDRYDSALGAWAAQHGVGTPAVPAGCEPPAHLYYLLLPTPPQRDAFIEHLRSRGILAVFHYLPLHLSPMGLRFGGAAGDCPVTERISQRLVRLPLYTDLTSTDQDDVIDAVLSFPI
jgi:dTDP-4-amino-4,6-dideoxygalactose transaminase